jgi:hypothetical protein
LGNAVLDPTAVPTAVDGGYAWSFLSAGRAHTCGRTTDLKAYCWGDGGRGQLGNGPLADQTEPVLVAGGFEWRSVSAGWNHTCGVTVDRDAYCWGEGGRGELGDGSSSDQPSPVKVAGEHEWDLVNAGRWHSCGIDTSGGLFCWGGRAQGSDRPYLVGIGPFDSAIPAAVRPDLEFKAVQTAETHTCALTADNQAYCWGNGDFGQLGIGNNLDYDVPRQVFRGVILP